MTTRPPRGVLVRVQRQPLLLGGRWRLVGAELRLPVDLAATLWSRCRVEMLQADFDLRRAML